MKLIEISILNGDNESTHSEVIEVHNENDNWEITTAVMKIADTYSFGPGDKIVVGQFM